jgi:hypothetical protein
MTIYQVRRNSDTWQLISVTELAQGPHVIEHGGVIIPLVIKDNTIIINPNEAEGTLFSVELPTLGGREGVTLDQKKDSKLVPIELKDGETGLHLFRDSNNTSLLIESASSPERF